VMCVTLANSRLHVICVIPARVVTLLRIVLAVMSVIPVSHAYLVLSVIPVSHAYQDVRIVKHVMSVIRARCRLRVNIVIPARVVYRVVKHVYHVIIVFHARVVIHAIHVWVVLGVMLAIIVRCVNIVM